MNYRHTYHAGNFADVFKHIILVALTQSLTQKETGFCYLDTHAGIGQYDLLTGPAQKNKEFKNGILKVLTQPKPPTLVQSYLECVQAMNPGTSDTLHYYPGSPAIVRHFLRPQDRMVLCELHEDDWESLKNNFHHDKQIAVHHQDGYQGLKAFLPPKERRGFVLIDPPYEKPDEATTAVAGLCMALERWETGTYALWYPIKERRSIERFHRTLTQKISHPVLIVELSIYPDNVATHLNGNGIAIVNPPWQLEQTIKEALGWLWRALSPDQQGRYDIKML